MSIQDTDIETPMSAQAVEEYRDQSLEHWNDAASGWISRQAAIREMFAPVSRWMVEAIDPQPGKRVLELAAGVGETGFIAAQRVGPEGRLLTSDQSEAMIEGARARAAQLGLENVELRTLNAEWIDLPVASVDGVLCRWGYMLMADPGAALGETRRVLRPGGRVALAVWDTIEANPWALIPAGVLVERGLSEPPAPGTPGPFALGSDRRVRELLEQSGFTEVRVEALELRHETASFEEFFQTTLDLSRVFHDAVLGAPEAEIEGMRASLAQRLAPYTSPDGSLSIPMRTLLAAGVA
jgi:ubiquinone/menaquinone biosynthesis C-methylase UbiE